MVSKVWPPQTLRSLALQCAVQESVGKRGLWLEEMCVIPITEWLYWGEAQTGVTQQQMKEALAEFLVWCARTPQREMSPELVQVFKRPGVIHRIAGAPVDAAAKQHDVLTVVGHRGQAARRRAGAWRELLPGAA